MENETEYKPSYKDLTEHSYPNDRKDGKNQQRDIVLWTIIKTESQDYICSIMTKKHIRIVIEEEQELLQNLINRSFNKLR